MFSNKYGKMMLLGLMLAVSIMLLAACQGSEPADSVPAEERITPVAVAEVIEGNVGRGASYTGDLELARETAIIPKVSGKVASVDVSAGDTVAQGQRLFTIDASDLQREVKRAEDSVRASEAQLNQTITQAENSIKRAEIGVRTSEAQLSQAILQRNNNIIKAEIALANATDAYNDAETQLVRMKALFEAGAIPRVEFEGAEMRYSSSKLQLQSAKEDLETAQQKDSIEIAEASLQSAKMELAAAQQRESIQIAEASLAQAVTGLEIIRAQLADTVVTAPVAGVVSVVNVNVGELVGQQAAMTLATTNPMLVKIPIPEHSIAKVNIGDIMPVHIPAMQMQLEGRVTHIGLSADRQSKTFPVELQIENDGSLRAGMMARIALTEQGSEPVPLVPNDAIITSGQQTSVFVIEDDVAFLQELVTGGASARWTEVVDGLEVGQQVVVRGQSLLQDQGKVRVTEVVVVDED
ncbi:efflux RND transporter periplasmic adaptor subunit [Desulfuribacillus alkaliarsenatis]|uniref:RND efflux pump membrane fusion protein barrel-sandwich domain-containing protein n=1 Tax=Desulfuribacillus alkaliarsenatis TaxID=766136 RepID=A0A1E5G3Q2_9FIRM|nr:efflux RND transporter periplasmic adaptor subunit [Desulfuribacillus alkaliarsenatis]OEF97646.1 hypothetical protein BHF68_14465 [Desulfuribacillus alkaliarsenatis]